MKLVFDAADLASFDQEQSAWVVDPGTYELRVGASSRDIRCRTSVDVEGSTTPVNRLFAMATPPSEDTMTR